MGTTGADFREDEMTPMMTFSTTREVISAVGKLARLKSIGSEPSGTLSEVVSKDRRTE